MAPTPSIKLVKSSVYEGGVHLWSNRYHFAGGTPSSQAHWNTLADAIVTAEKRLYPSQTTITGAVAYDAGSDLPLYSFSYSTAGIFSLAGGVTVAPLQCAAFIRWATTQRSTKNHPIYLYSWFHQAIIASGTARESLSSDYRAELAGFAAAWDTGFSDSTQSYQRAGPRGAVAQSYVIPTYVSHRDFPR